MTPSNSFPFWLDLLLRALPPILVVGGWVVVYYVQALQARRKLLREEADKARTAILGLQQQAVSFHTQEFSATERLKVLAALNDVERRCQMLPNIARTKNVLGMKDVSPVDDPVSARIPTSFIVALQRAITLDHFDDPQAPPLSAGAIQIWHITHSADELVKAVDAVLIAALD
ncbi:MAG: hypothetical protein EOO27_04795 [Comamonadaceae bacterium]|nr:MAG: hypothetical protein EOO27_04795 [Comamonadaceae bacterium]